MKKFIHILIHTMIFHLSMGLITDLSAQVHCDSSLILNTDNPLGYNNRGDRCEGIYIKEVGSTTLSIVSLTGFFEQYNIKSGKPIHIEWDKPPDDSIVHIRVQGIKRRLYYRMDTFQLSGTKSYTWSSDILASLNIHKEDIGIVGISRYFVGQTLHNVYLPLCIRQEESKLHIGSYKLILLPGVELTEVYISLAPTGSDGMPKEFIKDEEKLGYGYYPAERGIVISISGLQEVGTYYMEIGAILKAGGT
jgi:hypothetical protein